MRDVGTVFAVGIPFVTDSLRPSTVLDVELFATVNRLIEQPVAEQNEQKSSLTLGLYLLQLGRTNHVVWVGVVGGVPSLQLGVIDGNAILPPNVIQKSVGFRH